MMLMGLPGMTDDVADAILDWIDPDDNPRPNRRVRNTTVRWRRPTRCAEYGPPTTIEELLLVRGVTPELLFGLGRGQDGPDERHLGRHRHHRRRQQFQRPDGPRLGSLFDAVEHHEGNLRSDDSPKIDLNSSDLATLFTNRFSEAIDQPSAEFIIAYRLGGKGQADASGHLDISKLAQSDSSSSGSSANGSTGTGSTMNGGSSGGSAAGGGSGGTQINTLLDLVGATATLLPATTVTNGTGASATPGTGQSGSTIQIPATSIGSTGTSGSTGTAPATPNQVPVTNPFSADSGAMSNYLPKLFANCTTSQNTSTAGRINIDQAPRVVLLCIPNMTSDLANQIITQRSVDPTTATDVNQCPAWPLIRGLVPLATMKKLMPYVNAGGGVFRARVIGSFEKGGTSARVEAVIDATQSPSRIVFWKEGHQEFAGRIPRGTVRARQQRQQRQQQQREHENKQ